MFSQIFIAICYNFCTICRPASSRDHPAFLRELDRASHPVIKGFISKNIWKVKETGRLLKQQITLKCYMFYIGK